MCARFVGHLSHPGASCRQNIPDLPDTLAICKGSGRLLRVKRTTVPPNIASSALNEAMCPRHFRELSDNRASRTDHLAYVGGNPGSRTGLLVFVTDNQVSRTDLLACVSDNRATCEGPVACVGDNRASRTGLVAFVSDNSASPLGHLVFVSFEEASERVHLADFSDNPTGEKSHLPAMRGRETRASPQAPKARPWTAPGASPGELGAPQNPKPRGGGGRCGSVRSLQRREDLLHLAYQLHVGLLPGLLGELEIVP